MVHTHTHIYIYIYIHIHVCIHIQVVPSQARKHDAITEDAGTAGAAGASVGAAAAAAAAADPAVHSEKVEGGVHEQPWRHAFSKVLFTCLCMVNVLGR